MWWLSTASRTWWTQWYRCQSANNRRLKWKKPAILQPKLLNCSSMHHNIQSYLKNSHARIIIILVIALLSLLSWHADFSLPNIHFNFLYKKGFQCRLSDYGFLKLADLMESITGVVEVCILLISIYSRASLSLQFPYSFSRWNSPTKKTVRFSCRRALHSEFFRNNWKYWSNRTPGPVRP